MEWKAKKPGRSKGKSTVVDRQNRDDLILSGEEYLSLISNSLDIFYSIKPDGVITYVSPGVARYGYEPGEVISCNILDFVTADCREHVLRMYKDSLTQGETVPIEFKWQGKDGQIYWGEALGKTIFDSSGRPLRQVGVIRDVTWRKHAEKKLRDSEEKYRNIVEQVNDWVWEVDTRCLYTYASPRVLDLLGYEPEEMIGKSPFDFMQADEADLVREQFDHIFAARREFSLFENTLVRKDGSRVTVETSGVPMFDDDGIFAGYRGIDRDITERKRAEEEMRSARNMLRLIINNIPQGIFWKDRSSKYMGCNNIFATAAGLKSSEDIIGKTDYELPWFPEQTRNFREYDHKIMENDAPEYHIIEQQREADGKLAWIETNKIPLHDEQGNVIGVLGTYEDITERKRAEEALRQSEAMLNSIFRSAPTGIGVVIYRVINAVNDKLCQMTGFSREELLGKDARMLYPSDEEYERVGRVKYGMITERGVGEVETCWRRKDGTLIDILLSSSPIAPGDLSAGVTFTALDITKRKRAEEEVKEAKSQAELYLDLLGHDINNMHQIALGYLELARDMPASGRQNEFLDKPIEVLLRSAQLIKNVRKLQKLKEGVFLTQEVDVAAMLADVEREFGAIPGKTVTVNLNRCERCLVRANGLLYDVFANLVSNAIKHTGEHADIVIDLDIVKDKYGRYCRVMVEDNGPGIPDDFKGWIFNRMMKGDSKAKGMGLGLYLVKSLVESYGGRVWVEDRITGDYRKGARFVVLLPESEPR